MHYRFTQFFDYLQQLSKTYHQSYHGTVEQSFFFILLFIEK